METETVQTAVVAVETVEPVKTTVRVRVRKEAQFMGATLAPGRHEFPVEDGYIEISYGRGNMQRVSAADVQKQICRGELTRSEDGTIVVS